MPSLVKPFIAAATPELMSEMSVVLSLGECPWSSKDISVLFSEGGYRFSPGLAKIQYFKREIVISLTIFTSVRNEITARLGQDIVLGVAISPKAYLMINNIAETSFRLIMMEMKRLGDETKQNPFSILALRLGSSQDNQAQVLRHFEKMLSIFDTLFSQTAFISISSMRKLAHRLKIKILLNKKLEKPILNMEQLSHFCRKIDYTLSSASADKLELDNLAFSTRFTDECEPYGIFFDKLA